MCQILKRYKGLKEALSEFLIKVKRKEKKEKNKQTINN